MKRDVKNNADLVVWHTLLLNILFFIPILVVYYRDAAGVGYEGFMLTQSIYSATVIVMDVPTGLLADIWTRRTTLIVATAIYALGELLLFAGHGFWMLAFAQTVLGVGVSLLSGAKMALMYDSMIEAGQEAAYRRKQGFVHAVGLYATGAGALCGGLMYQWNKGLPILFSIVACLLAIIPSVMVVEPARHREAIRRHPVADMLTTMRYALHGHAEIAGIILLSAVLFSATRMIFWAQQPYFTMLGFSPAWFGVLTALCYLSAGLAGQWGYLLDRRFTTTQTLGGCLAFIIAACLFCGLWPGVVGAGVLLAGWTTFGIGWPRAQAGINYLVDSSRRATILSTANFTVSLFQIPVMILSGMLEDRYNIRASLLAMAVMAAAGWLAAAMVMKTGQEKLCEKA